GIDDIQILQRPDNGKLANCLENDTMMLYHNCINVLENYTLAHYPETALLKKKMQNLGGEWTLMSGSGPTVFTIFRSVSDAERASEILKDDGYEAYWTETMA
ncbi:MAG: hypothetical protein PUC44_06920, partial [Eubacteriales bacterium]|nr:hypothetical protein [Eubacteriales bacterium]